MLQLRVQLYHQVRDQSLPSHSQPVTQSPGQRLQKESACVIPPFDTPRPHSLDTPYPAPPPTARLAIPAPYNSRGSVGGRYTPS
eukprot:7655629-Pyramimonas_sp.AAC.2